MLPEIYCPFPVRVNPHAGETEEHLRAVLDELGADGGLRGAGLGRLAALAYPDVEADRLRIAGLWFAFFWLFDDAWADRMPLHAAGELGRVHGRVAAVLAGDRPVATDHCSVRVLGQLAEAIRAARPGWDASAFHREILRYTRATLWEVDLRRRGVIPSLPDYLRMRPLIAAVPPSRELDFLLCDLRLDTLVAEDPLVGLAGAAAGNYSCWVNDICSLDSEQGGPANIVVVAQHRFGWPWQRAVEWAAEVAAGEVETFQELRRSLPALLPGHAADLERYLGHYEGWFVASARWMPSTAKYRRGEVPA